MRTSKKAGTIEIGDTYLDNLNRPRTVTHIMCSVENIHLTDKLGNNIYPVDELLEIVLPYSSGIRYSCTIIASSNNDEPIWLCESQPKRLNC